MRIRFDKQGFKEWFHPSTGWLNPTLPPKTVFDVLYVPLYFITFGWLMVPMAFLASLHLVSKETQLQALFRRVSR